MYIYLITMKTLSTWTKSQYFVTPDRAIEKIILIKTNYLKIHILHLKNFILLLKYNNSTTFFTGAGSVFCEGRSKQQRLREERRHVWHGHALHRAHAKDWVWLPSKGENHPRLGRVQPASFQDHGSSPWNRYFFNNMTFIRFLLQMSTFQRTLAKRTTCRCAFLQAPS